MIMDHSTVLLEKVSCLKLTFEALAAAAGKKVAAMCAEAICHYAPAGQTTDVNSYGNRK